MAVAASWELRSWALAHPTEFGLLFGSPPPGYAVPSEGPLHEAGRRFVLVFADLFESAGAVEADGFGVADHV